MFDLSLLSQAIDHGDREKTIRLTTEALSTGVGSQDIIAHGLQAGMAVVGEKFSSGEYFLPDMLMAARAMDAALEVLQPSLEKTGMPTSMGDTSTARAPHFWAYSRLRITRSGVPIRLSTTRPAFTRPGARTMSGTRMDSSYGFALEPTPLEPNELP